MAATSCSLLDLSFPAYDSSTLGRPFISTIVQPAVVLKEWIYCLKPSPSFLGSPWLEPPDAGPPLIAKPSVGSGMGAAFFVPATSLGWFKFGQPSVSCLAFL